MYDRGVRLDLRSVLLPSAQNLRPKICAKIVLASCKALANWRSNFAAAQVQLLIPLTHPDSVIRIAARRQQAWAQQLLRNSFIALRTALQPTRRRRSGAQTHRPWPTKATQGTSRGRTASPRPRRRPRTASEPEASRAASTRRAPLEWPIWEEVNAVYRETPIEVIGKK